jgi:class 3 adenylate cyclase/WD40 repeat protein
MTAAALPTGTVTFLFTDIEGSTRLLHALGDRYADALADHRRLVRAGFLRHSGVEVDTQGDSFFVAFADPRDALAAAEDCQRALLQHLWPDHTAVLVRMGLHTGEPLVSDDHYVGIDVHRAARIAAAAHGGQVIVSERTRKLIDGAAYAGGLRDLGSHRLKDLPEPERLFQLVADGLPKTFPPPRGDEPAIEAAGLPDYSLPPAEVPCPYKGLPAFEPQDHDLFYGREELTAELAARLTVKGVLAVVGPSGSGKSSLVRAGVVPALAAGVRDEVHAAIFSPGAHPLAELAARREAPLLVVDQFEEVFTLCRDEEERRAFIDALLDAAAGARVIIVLRADFYGHCAAYPRLVSALEERQSIVGPMTEEELRRAIERPAERAGLVLEPGVVEGILRDVVGEPGALPLLSHSLLETWRRRSGRMLTLVGYLRSGGVQGAVAKTAEAVYRDVLSPEQQQLARNIFVRLTEIGQGTEDSRRRVSTTELVRRAGQEAAVADVLRTLADARLVTIGEGTVEVAHEALIRHWPTLRQWLDEDREGTLLHRRLTEAAQEWEALGRDPGALFRGARLATAGDWATAHDPELNELEREFLTVSRRASQGEVEHQRRVNRRLRGLLIGALILLGLALAAGTVAVVQQRHAQHSADVATAQRLGALVPVQNRPDIALQLAVESALLDHSRERKGALFETLMKYRHMLRVVRIRERILRMDAPANGDVVAASDISGHLLVYRPATLALRRTRTLPFIADVAFAPNGRTVYVEGFRTATGETHAIRAVDVDTGRIRWAQQAPGGDGRLTVASDGQVLWFVGGRLHFLRPLDGAASRRALDTGAETVLPLRGHRVLALGRASASVLDTRSGRVVRRLALAGGVTTERSGAVSRDGSMLALGRPDGSVYVVRLETGKRVELQARHKGPVEVMRFSPEGSLLATAGDPDSRLLLSNPRTGALVDTLSGHGSGLRALAFAPDGRTLVSGGLDSTLIAWDVKGDRAMVRTFERPGPPCPECQFTLTPDGKRLVLVNLDGSVSFVDAATLRPAGGLPARARACCAEPGLSPDGKWIATVSIEPSAVTLWDTRTGQRVRELFSSRQPWNILSPPGTVAYAPDGSSVATNEGDDVVLIDPRTGRTLARFVAPAFVWWLSYSPDSALLEAAAADGSHTVWDVKTRRQLWSRRIDNRPAPGGRFSPDRRLLIVGSGYGRIHVLDASSGRPTRAPLVAHSAFLASLAFNNDGSIFASADTDGQAILWDAASGRALGSPFDAKRAAWTHFSADGNTLYVLTGERGYVFDASLRAWTRRACSVAGRGLTHADWKRFMGDRAYRPACSSAQ